MKKFKEAILITKENFVDIALMPCVRGITREKVLCQGISNAFFEPVLRIEVGNESGTIGDYLVKDVCGNFHIMNSLDYQRQKDEIL